MKILSHFSTRPFSTHSHRYNKCIKSPIFYVNAAPHIGHLYTAVYCDSLARYHRLKANDKQAGFFSIGTDEHGMKIQKRALQEGFTNPLQMCDENSMIFKNLFAKDKANVDYDRFIRTTDE